MTAKHPFEISADPVRNLLRITYHGEVTVAATKLLADQAEKLIPKLSPGFTALTDLTGMGSMDLKCVPHVARVMELCKAHGIGTTMRVIPDPKKDIGLTILARVRYSSTVRILTFQNLTEAEAALRS